MKCRVALQDGILGEYYKKIKDHFISEIDETEHMEAYATEHKPSFAGPEFAGKYVDICMKYYKDTGDDRFLEKAKRVVDSIIAKQKSNGYIGGLPEEYEWETFSVWNQTFTVRGLLAYYYTTKDESVLETAEKSVINMANHYMGNSENDILDALNDGTQNISVLLILPDLYEITGKQIYMDFMIHIIDKMKNNNLNFFEFDDIMKLRSKKGIENFVILLGMLDYGDLTGDASALNGAKKYWEQVNDTQIRNTGNGTLKEFWTENGNLPAMIDLEEKPNENCVAVGWIEFCYMLFLKCGEAKYLDAIEKTMFNHILGGLSTDGRDFAYYQPNYGKKVLTTSANLYQCCRYRGFMLFSYMRDALYQDDGNAIVPLIYTNSEYSYNDLTISQITDYPADNKIHFKVEKKNNRRQTLKLRIPAWCNSFSVSLNGVVASVPTCEGFVLVELEDGLDICLTLNMHHRIEESVIDGVERIAVTYGPMLLALDSHFGNSIWETSLLWEDGIQLKPIDNPEAHNMEFVCDGVVNGERVAVHLVDYCSAAKGSPDDEFLVWIPVDKS